jgi:hypothetical protein
MLGGRHGLYKPKDVAPFQRFASNGGIDPPGVVRLPVFETLNALCPSERLGAVLCCAP